MVGRGISIIEAIDQLSSHEFENPEDKLHRDLSVFIALAHELSPTAMRVVLDGKPRDEDFLLVEVLNIGHAGPRIELTQSSDSGDGFFEVVLANLSDRERLLQSLEASLSGHPGKPVLESIKARSVQLKLGPGEFRLDDEVLLKKADFKEGKLSEIEIDLTILPQALRLIGRSPK